MTKDQIFATASALPLEERFELAIQLWESVEGSPVDLREDIRLELDRRIAEDDTDGSAGEDWEAARGKLLRGEC